MMSLCWKTITLLWVSNCCKKNIVTSSRISPRSSVRHSGKWSLTWYGIQLLFSLHLSILYLHLLILLGRLGLLTGFGFLSFFFQGVSNWYVQTYEPAGRPEDNGRNKKSYKFRCSSLGQLHWSYTGISFKSEKLYHRNNPKLVKEVEEEEKRLKFSLVACPRLLVQLWDYFKNKLRKMNIQACPPIYKEKHSPIYWIT